MTGILHLIFGLATILAGVIAISIECRLSYYAVPVWAGVLVRSHPSQTPSHHLQAHPSPTHTTSHWLFRHSLHLSFKSTILPNVLNTSNILLGPWGIFFFFASHVMKEKERFFSSIYMLENKLNWFHTSLYPLFK